MSVCPHLIAGKVDSCNMFQILKFFNYLYTWRHILLHCLMVQFHYDITHINLIIVFSLMSYSMEWYIKFSKCLAPDILDI